MRTQSKGGARYFATFIDDYSGWYQVYFLKSKDEIFDAFVKYKNLAETETGNKIKALQTDNGKEYCNTKFRQFLDQHGIQQRLSIPYNPQQNGVAERRNRTLLDMARCQLIQAQLPPSFWAEAVGTANYIRNRCTSKALANETPFELWKGWTPVVGHMRTFGTKVFILNKNPTKGKFEPRSKEGIFIGYPEHAKGYRVWIPAEKKAVVSRDIRFSNEIDHETDKSGGEGSILLEVKPDEPTTTTTEIGPNAPSFAEPVVRRGRGRPRIIRSGSKGRPRKEYCCGQGHSDSDSSTSKNSNRGRKRPPNTPTQNNEKRNRIQSEEEEDDEGESGEFGESDDEVVADQNADNRSESQVNYLELAMNAVEISASEACKGRQSEEWKEAIKSEIESHIRYDTWEITDRPRDRNVIGSKTVLKNKFKPDGTLERKKARIVARGFAQRPEHDYFDTFAPVARLDSVRTLMALAVEHQLIIHQLHITTAYLNGSINEEIFMEIPEGLAEGLEEVSKA